MNIILPFIAGGAAGVLVSVNYIMSKTTTNTKVQHKIINKDGSVSKDIKDTVDICIEWKPSWSTRPKSAPSATKDA